MLNGDQPQFEAVWLPTFQTETSSPQPVVKKDPSEEIQVKHEPVVTEESVCTAEDSCRDFKTSVDRLVTGGRTKEKLDKKTCMVRGCEKTGKSGMRFHTFPRSPERCLKWAEFCENTGLEGVERLPYSLRTHIFICASHFATESYQNHLRQKLLWKALPSLLPPSSFPPPVPDPLSCAPSDKHCSSDDSEKMPRRPKMRRWKRKVDHQQAESEISFQIILRRIKTQVLSS